MNPRVRTFSPASEVVLNVFLMGGHSAHAMIGIAFRPPILDAASTVFMLREAFFGGIRANNGSANSPTIVRACT